MSEHRHWHHYEHLCTQAHTRGLHVNLAVKAAQYAANGRRTQDPTLASIEITDPTSGMRPLAAAIYNDDLDAAATELLARLAR